MNMQEPTTDIMRSHIFRLAGESHRHDGRRLDEIREVRLEPGYVTSAEGSCRARLGRTDVVVGVKMDLGTPYPDSPDVGMLTTNAELLPMASPNFEAGPPSQESIELARVVDRGIRESRCLPMKQLCITPKEKVWMVFIDCHVVDFDGNLFDCTNLAAITALLTAKVPSSKKGLGEDYKLPIQHVPITVTTAKLDRTLVVDPSGDEEGAAGARLTVCADENGDIRAMQKGFRGAMTVDEVRRSVDLSRRLGPVLRAQVEDVAVRAGGMRVTAKAGNQ